jgi:hypothetical protein
MNRVFFVYLSATFDEDRDGVFDEQHDHRRALLGARSERPPLLARARAGLSRRVRRDRHSLTGYPCRLPSGKIGRTAIVLVDGEWTAICAVA